MELSRFTRASDFFSELEHMATPLGRAVVPTRNADKHFNTAAYAAAIIYSLKHEKLLDLEKRRVVHPSTSTGSLSLAMSVINKYHFWKETEFSGDDYQQLKRTCNSAQRFLEDCKGHYHAHI